MHDNMIDDENFLILEGTVVGDCELIDVGQGKKAMNIMVDSFRNTLSGEKYFRYHVVLWHTAAMRYKDDLKDGVFVRIKGHLQESECILEGGKRFKYSKPVADFIQIEGGES